MITNLVFKRTVNIEGSQKTEMKIIKVKIDGIRSAEGWSLVSSADICTFDDQSEISDHGISTDKLPEVVLCEDALSNKVGIDEDTNHAETVNQAKYENIKEFYTNISGTACLIRRDGRIRIAYRKGPSSDKVTPNKVCIDDHVKSKFFKDVRALKGECTSDWFISEKDSKSYFDFWNNWMDEIYQEDRNNAIKLMIFEDKNR